MIKYFYYREFSSVFYGWCLQDTGYSSAQNSCTAKHWASQEFPHFRGGHPDNKAAFNLQDFSSLLLANKPGSSPCWWEKRINKCILIYQVRHLIYFFQHAKIYIVHEYLPHQSIFKCKWILKNCQKKILCRRHN